ncbi:MAG: S-methyl-5-thioribose-1-phosphate isomerase [Candidatus Lokiarchaeota archaeon]|nr:S-methyl-5-thioribose-1-phosphate isomerase [Candidatus Lokiarchaeota archaeon]
MKELLHKLDEIKSLRVQGATNVAKYGMELLHDFTQRHQNLPARKLFNDLIKAKELIKNARATEPALRNGLQFVLNKLNYLKEDPSVNIADYVTEYSKIYIETLRNAKERIKEIGSERIPTKRYFNILTHCHSSVVTGILLRAKEQQKNFHVFCTETRPRFQGYITAQELLDANIETTLVVDSAMRWVVRNYPIDMILIGADAITSEGTVLNKIGSRLLALVAREMHIPYYVATPLLKYNPESVFGTLEKIEMRDYTEIWENKPKELKIKNPAFETVSRRYIDALITEAGIFPATLVSRVFYEQYPDLKPVGQF